MSRFDRFRTEQIRTERELVNERNCFQHDAKPENLACHRSRSLVILFIQSIKELLAGFCVVYIVRMRPEGQMIQFFQNTLTIANKIEQSNTFFVVE